MSFTNTWQKLMGACALLLFASSATVLANEFNTSAYEAKTAKPLSNEELVVAFSIAPPFVIVDTEL